VPNRCANSAAEFVWLKCPGALVVHDEMVKGTELAFWMVIEYTHDFNGVDPPLHDVVTPMVGAGFGEN
jgi:hypothetical protein